MTRLWLIAMLAFLLLAGMPPVDAQTYTVLHKFTGPDGAHPVAGLTMDAVGNLYGAATGGGATGVGTVFKLDTSGKFTVLTSFNFVSGGAAGNAWGDLILDSAGNIYGTTLNGGAFNGNGSPCDSYDNGCGAVFKLAPNGQGSVLYAFDPNVRDGINPFAGLIQDAAGNLYGTASDACGGALPVEWGSVFKLDPGGNATNLFVFNVGDFTGTAFTAAADGGCPTGRLVMDAEGNLYGTTAGNFQGLYFGAYIASMVFKLTPNLDGIWTRTVLHTFRGYDGDHSRSGLIFDAAGNLYGTTFNGGGSKNCPDGCGAVFKLIANPDGSWTERVLHTFANRPSAHPF